MAGFTDGDDFPGEKKTVFLDFIFPMEMQLQFRLRQKTYFLRGNYPSIFVSWVGWRKVKEVDLNHRFMKQAGGGGGIQGQAYCLWHRPGRGIIWVIGKVGEGAGMYNVNQEIYIILKTISLCLKCFRTKHLD